MKKINVRTIRPDPLDLESLPASEAFKLSYSLLQAGTKHKMGKTRGRWYVIILGDPK